MAKNNLEMDIDDALIEKTHGFIIESADGKGERHFLLYPVTLGKAHLLKRHLDNLEINEENIKINPFLETLRVVEKNKFGVCKLIAYHTLKKKRDIFNNEVVEEIATFINENSSNDEIASLFLYILTRDNILEYKKHLGIAKENDRFRQVINYKERIKKGRSDYSFGGKTIYGTLIDVACERYGWTLDYVLWGISLVNLQLMLSDRVQNIYLSDEEKKKIPSRLLNNADTINADDKANLEKILRMNWK